jgi:Na+-driven multidrug efflux pump
MTDGFFVARGVGPTALASVNIAIPFINFIFSVSIFCASGASTVISIYLGRGDGKSARDAFMTNFAFLLGLSAVITFFALARTPSLAAMLGATEHMAEGVTAYLRIIAAFSGFFIMTYFFEMMLRVDGHPRLATVSGLLAGITNVALDYLFVIKFHWGLSGAAYATGIAQMIPALTLAAYFKLRGRKLGFSKFRFDFSFVRRGLGLGFGDSVTEFSVGIAIFFFNHRILRITGEDGVVSYTVIAYVATLVVMTMCGISQGMLPLSSYSHGRNDAASVVKILKLALATASVCGAAWFAIAELFAPGVVSIFIDGAADGGLHASTVRAFRLYAPSFAIVGVNVVLATFFSTVERPGYGIALSLCRGVFVMAASLYMMSALFGIKGIWLSPAVSEAFCAAIGIFLFTRRAKRTRSDGR